MTNNWLFLSLGHSVWEFYFLVIFLFVLGFFFFKRLQLLAECLFSFIFAFLIQAPQITAAVAAEKKSFLLVNFVVAVLRGSDLIVIYVNVIKQRKHLLEEGKDLEKKSVCFSN